MTMPCRHRMMKTPMGIAAMNLAAANERALLGTRLRADCDDAGVQASDLVDAWT
jgi:hypothetical protein